MVNVEIVLVLKMEGSVGHLDVCHRDVKTQQPIWNRVTTLRIDYLLILSQIFIMLHLSGMISLSIDSSNSNNNNNFNNFNDIDNENSNDIGENDHQSSITLPPFTTMSPPTFVWSEKTLFSQLMLHMSDMTK